MINGRLSNLSLSLNVKIPYQSAHISRPEVIISTLCPETANWKRKWEQAATEKNLTQ